MKIESLSYAALLSFSFLTGDLTAFSSLEDEYTQAIACNLKLLTEKG